MRKRSVLFVALLLISATLFAKPVMMNWVWELENPKVTTVRYQVDGENPNKWIVVDSSVTSYTAEGLDGTQTYTLYIQQSYDGQNFSESSKLVSEAIYSAEAEAKAKADSRSKTIITLGGGANYIFNNTYADPSLDDWSAKLDLGLQFKNMRIFSEKLGLGLDVGLTYTSYLAEAYGWESVGKDIFFILAGDFGEFLDALTHTFTLSAAPMLNMQLGKIAVDLGGGGFITYGSKFNSTKDEKFMYGAFTKVALAYQVNDQFSWGAAAKFNFVLSDFNDFTSSAEVGLYLGYSF